MLRWSSKSRCCVQVTSNVRHPKAKKFKDKKDTRFGKVVSEDISHSAKNVQVGRNRNCAGGGQKVDGAKFDQQKLVKNCALCFSCQPLRVELLRKRHDHASSSWWVQPPTVASRSRNLKPQRRKNQRLSHGLALFHGHASYGSIQDMVAALFRVARMPNPSVNLTRNSVPRWPNEARYAHNAPLVHRVTLSHAGYLKR
jgi:hypothetical protein